MIPKLRFPLYNQPFVKKSINEILTIGGGKDYKHLSKGGIPVYGTGGLMTTVNDHLYDGESVGIGRKGTIDKPIFLKGKFWTVDTLFYTHSFEDVDPYYVFTLFQQINWKKYNEASGVPSLSKTTVGAIQVYVPRIEEQLRIRSLFEAVDQKTNLLTKKKEALETYKNGLMQKIFSRELRFKREDGTGYPEWSNSTLDELFTSKKGKGLSLKDIADDGANKCLLYGSLYTKYNEVISRCIEFTNTIESVFANNNDLLVPASTTTSGIDLATFSCLQINDVMIGGDVTILTPLDKQDSRWWAYYLSHHKKTDIAKFAQGSTIVHLYFNHFKKLKVEYPTIEEQRKTVELLVGVDTKISRLQTQISMQSELKKGLLQQMFI